MNEDIGLQILEGPQGYAATEDLSLRMTGAPRDKILIKLRLDLESSLPSLARWVEANPVELVPVLGIPPQREGTFSPSGLYSDGTKTAWIAAPWSKETLLHELAHHVHWVLRDRLDHVVAAAYREAKSMNADRCKWCGCVPVHIGEAALRNKCEFFAYAFEQHFIDPTALEVCPPALEMVKAALRIMGLE